MLTREELEKREYDFLAPYALKAAESAGRDRAEPLHRYRTAFQRDRDRVIHCSSFRRLEYKTQVFVNHAGDNFRTRLTHTMEVAQIARSIARTMQLNEDFAEALGLAHDLGHPPFGHAGEQALDDIMKDEGGFEHNWQSRRIVRELENDFAGLNLTREVSESIIKHRTAHDHGPADTRGSYLETQAVNLADEISYNCHDLDDGIAAGILEIDDLAGLAIWQQGIQAADADYPGLSSRQRIRRIVVSILNFYVTDLINTSEVNIREQGIASVADVLKQDTDVIVFSADVARMNRDLQNLLMDRLYRHSSVVRMSYKAARFIREIFAEYELHPGSLPESYQAWARRDGVGIRRAIADYIAGMTDRYAQDEYRKLFYPYT